MSDRTWSLEVVDGIAVCTFTRPPANWMDNLSMGYLAELLGGLGEATDDVRVVMLTGGIDGYFVAHADLDDLARSARGDQPPGDPGSWGRALGLLAALPQPTVAAIDGQAWGGGCELSLACDMRIGSERLHMAQPEVAIGIIPGSGGTQRLPRLVGRAKGIELCTSGRRVFAEEALRIGLVNAVLPTEGFREAAIRWCSKIARHPAGAVTTAKRAVVDGLELSLADGLALESRLFRERNESDEARKLNAAVARP